MMESPVIESRIMESVLVTALLVLTPVVLTARHKVTVDQRPFSFPDHLWPPTSDKPLGSLTKPLYCEYTRVNSRMIWTLLTSGQLRKRCPTMSCSDWSFFLNESEIWEKGRTLGIPVRKLPNGYFLSATQKGQPEGNITEGCDSQQELVYSSEIVMIQDVISKEVYTIVNLRARCGVDYHQPILVGHCRNTLCCERCASKMKCMPKVSSQKFLVEGDNFQIFVKDIYVHTHCACQKATP